jgi:hypothetical protein
MVCTISNTPRVHLLTEWPDGLLQFLLPFLRAEGDILGQGKAGTDAR